MTENVTVRIDDEEDFDRATAEAVEKAGSNLGRLRRIRTRRVRESAFGKSGRFLRREFVFVR